MRPGTPGFIGHRLREAREARGMTVSELAKELEISQQAVSRYELEKMSPSPNTSMTMAHILGVPLARFTSESNCESISAIFHRAQIGTTSRKKKENAVKLHKTAELYFNSFQWLTFPRLDLPDFFISGDPINLDTSEIESYAEQLRQHWNLGNGPIANMVELVERKGMPVSWGRSESNKVDAYSAWYKMQQRDDEDQVQIPVIFLSREKGSSVRSRFEIAHELAHLLLHRTVSEDKLKDKTYHSHLEKQAHIFAGAFLLPEAEFVKDAYSQALEALKGLKNKWRVSIGAMIRRLAHLRIISEKQERLLWIGYSRRGWRTGEPFDDSIPPEVPSLLRLAVEVPIESGATTGADLESQLHLFVWEIEMLSNLPVGTVASHFQRNIANTHRKLKNNNVQEKGDDVSYDNLYPFPSSAET